MLLLLYCSCPFIDSSVFQASRKVKTGSATSSPRCFHSYCVRNPSPYHYHLCRPRKSYQHGKVLSGFYFPRKRPQGPPGPCWKRCEDDVGHLIRNPTKTTRHQEFQEINSLKRLSQTKTEYILIMDLLVVHCNGFLASENTLLGRYCM